MSDINPLSQNMPHLDQPKKIALLVSEGAQSLDISGPLDCFLEVNNQLNGSPAYDVRLVSTTSDRVVRASGMSVVCDTTIEDDNDSIDTLLVCGTLNHRSAYNSQLHHMWLRDRAANSRRYGSICTGAFFLGAAGLLDGKQSTTHWEHVQELAAAYPATRVEPNSIYVVDGRLYTSAGVSAGTDLALRLVEDDLGRDLAMLVARRLLVFLKRPGGQSQFSVLPVAQTVTQSRITTIQDWIINHLTEDLSVGSLSKRASMSPRNFARVFQSETGMTPKEFIESARVELARRLLQDGRIPMQKVAGQCGFGGLDVMRRAFMRKVGVRPSEYRSRF